MSPQPDDALDRGECFACAVIVVVLIISAVLMVWAYFL